MEAGDRRGRNVPERLREGGRPRYGLPHRLRLGEAREATDLGRVAGEEPPLVRAYDRGVRPEPLHVREQFPAGQGLVLVHRALESLQEADDIIFEDGARRDVPRHRDARVQARTHVVLSTGPQRHVALTVAPAMSSRGTID